MAMSEMNTFDIKIAVHCPPREQTAQP